MTKSPQAKRTAGRRASIERITGETSIKVVLALDEVSPPKISTGIGFFDHMLEQIGVHGRMSLEVEASGDLHVDSHHLVEDTGIAFGTALAQALGERPPVKRFAGRYVPLDEALTRVVLDLSGRPGLFFHCDFTQKRLGPDGSSIDCQVLREFFQGFANNAKATLHIDNLKGDNAHHQAETLFKGLALVLRDAVLLDETLSQGDVASSKGMI